MAVVAGLGAGGHATVVLDILRLRGEHQVVCLLDPDSSLWGKEILGIPVRGGDELMAGLYAGGIRHAFVGVGGAGDTAARQRLFQAARDTGFDVVDAIHPAAVISPSARFGAGTQVMAGAVVNPHASLGDNVIVNTGAVVEHGCVVGAHAHIATGARLGGDVRVGEGAHVGLGASVRQGITLGARSVVGAGAAVVKDVRPGALVAGVPARPGRQKEVSAPESDPDLP